MLEQHLALVLVDAAQGSGQHRLGTGQVGAEGDLLGADGAREGARGHVSHQLCLLIEVGEELIKFG